ncbi:Na+/H+ antiporter subunit E [Ramlibacter sp. Leaf400]|uniref:Na+/H+ antiporter subunit E n=1 Tax=Ramlibacter sp. Leaf400 TaxID=1736365 RepID=UPI0006FA34FD|nr:Na+/H+ antiporter subunit E [Ramlibacter sp. Leaf400]KQT13336.1 cation:proton antiporter [Ramlibacter sp. Leaf400]
MKRWFPSPLLSAGLWAMWLVLNDSLAPAHLLLGAVLGWALPWLVAPLRPAGPAVRRPLVLARLVLRVGRDVIVSGLAVARGVMTQRVPRGAFVRVPLELRDPHALAALAIITTVVPGTVWSELAPDRSAVLLHVFEPGDEAVFVAQFKADYERPLLEIFG